MEIQLVNTVIDGVTKTEIEGDPKSFTLKLKHAALAAD